MPLIPRTEWAVAPLEGEALITVPIAQRDGFIVHWDGGPTPTTAAGELDLLRGYEAYHRRTDAAGGLKYNLAVGPVTGNVYEGRGLDKRGMHTGGANTPNIGCIVIGGPGNLTDAATAGLREAFLIACSYAGRDLARRVHSDLNQTACPGDELRAFVKGGGIVTPSLPIPQSSTVSLGGGRGSLAPNPAASIRRIDAQLGRLADINDAWRSPETADANARAYELWRQGRGPKAPYALDRWGSIHCRGYATDSDDWYDPAAAAIWRRGGWRQTALYPVGDPRREEWHAEYDESRDEFLGQPAGSGGNEFEEDDMSAADVEKILADINTVHLAVLANKADIGTVHDSVLSGRDDTASVRTLVASVKADINYIHTLSPFSLKAILAASSTGEIKLTTEQTAAISGQLAASTAALLREGFAQNSALMIKEISELPAEIRAELAAALSRPAK